MKNVYGETWEMPQWMVDKAKEWEGERRLDEETLITDTQESTLRSIQQTMSGYLGSTLEILSGKDISEDPKVPMPKPYLELYPNLPAEVPARVAKVLNAHFERNGGVDIRDVMNNFSINMVQRSAYGNSETIISPHARIVNWPSVKATKKGERWSDFDETVERLGLKKDFLATLDKNGDHTPGKTNSVLFPVFIDMACRGWAIAPLMG